MVNVLMATSEAVPIAKTGGLADVCGALPAALQQLGCDCTLIMPAYPSVRAAAEGRPHPAGAADEIGRVRDLSVQLNIRIGSQWMRGRVLEGRLANGVRALFIDQPHYFDRPGLYGERGDDYRDNCERFVFFCRAVLETIQQLDLQTELIHCNDWPTAFIPVLLDAEHRGTAHDRGLATLLTIHNLAYQGRFWHWDMLLTGLDWNYFHWKRLEFYGHLNFLKGGIVYADTLTTVSPRYAEEIQTPTWGCGLDGALHQRRKDLTGILNGVDYEQWNPATDPHLPQAYGPHDWQIGKAACKAHLQQRLNLPRAPRVPLIGIIGRLVEQKGIDLILELLHQWAPREEAQWVILGTGPPETEAQVRQVAAECPQRVAATIGFSDALAHQIEGGADLFLMPSRFEPCGLNQLYSLKYGTLPLVHATGGLADTVTPCNPENLAAGTANGFAFTDFGTTPLDAALRNALDVYRRQPHVWQQLVARGMSQDWSWQRSAQQYARLYQETVARVRQTLHA